MRRVRPGCSQTAASASSARVATTVAATSRELQVAALEHAQHRLGREARGPQRPPALHLRHEVQRPRAQRHRQRQDRGARGAVGDGRRRDRERAHDRAAAEVPEQHDRDLRRVQVPAVPSPEGQRHEPRQPEREPGREQHAPLDREHRRQADGPLQQQRERAALLLRAHQPDRDEREEQRRDEGVRAEGRHDDPVERAQALRERGRSAGDAARLRVRVHRGDERVPDERPDREPHEQQRARGEQLACVLAGERQEPPRGRAAVRRARLRRAQGRPPRDPPSGRPARVAQLAQRALRDRAPVLQQHEPVAQACRVAHAVDRHDQRASAGGDPSEERDRVARQPQVEAVERLVEQQHGVRREQRGGDEHALPLPLRQRADRPVVQLGQSQRRMHVVAQRGVAVAVERAREVEHPARGLRLPRRDAVGKVEQHPARATVERTIRPTHAARVGGEQARHGLQQRRLAGAVGPEEAEHLALVRGEAGVVEREERAEAAREPRDGQSRHAAARQVTITARGARARGRPAGRSPSRRPRRPSRSPARTPSPRPAGAASCTSPRRAPSRGP